MSEDQLFSLRQDQLNDFRDWMEQLKVDESAKVALFYFTDCLKVDELHRTEFSNFVKLMHTWSGIFWTPGGKNNSETLASFAFLLLRRFDTFFPSITGIKLQKHNSGHIWLEVVFPDTCLIFDPYGIPVSYTEEGVRPFFGKRELAPAAYREIYSHGANLDEEAGV